MSICFGVSLNRPADQPGHQTRQEPIEKSAYWAGGQMPGVVVKNDRYRYNKAKVTKDFKSGPNPIHCNGAIHFL